RLTRYEYAVSEDRGLRAQDCRVDIAEGPLELEFREVSRRVSTARARLETGVGRAVTPAVPARRILELRDRGMSRARVGPFRAGCPVLGGSKVAAGGIFRHRVPLGIAEQGALCLHLAAGESSEDGFRRKLPQHFTRQCAQSGFIRRVFG